jgi:membrane carboxypeptidase/penicillin-binding protein
VPPAVPPRGAPGGLEWVAPGSRLRKPAGRLRRYCRRARRFLLVVSALGLLGTIMAGGLLMITPATSNAPAVAQALARAHHVPYPGPPVPAKFAEALATENLPSYSEAGAGPGLLAMAGFGSLTGRPGQDATLYQRLAGVLYTHGHGGRLASAERAVLGVKLSFGYPQRSVLQMYAAVTYFGHGYYGLASASCGYFGIPPARLSWAQAAVLAGLALAPSADDPVTHLPSARAAGAKVIARLAAARRLTPTQAARASREPLHLTRGHAATCAAP